MFPHELITRYDKESLKKYWSIYRDQWNEPLQLKKADVLLSNKKVETNELMVAQLSENIEDKEQTTIIKRKEKEDVVSNNIVIPTTNIVLNREAKIIDARYFVQIAASKTPISKQLLSKLYSGSDSIIIRQEEGWLKYQLGGTQNFIQAEKIKQSANVLGAFVVAYRNDSKQLLWKTKSWQDFMNSSSGLEFVVQVSANQKQMNEKKRQQLEAKLGGVIREVVENGWYKYQLIVGSSYPEAVKKWKQVGTTISFVVSYQNNKKIKLSEAIKVYNEYKIR